MKRAAPGEEKITMNDDEVLASVRASLTGMRDTLGGVHMNRPAAAVLARGRARRRRRWVSGVAAAGAAAAAAVLLVSGSQQVPGLTPGKVAAGSFQARTTAYVVRQVEHALASSNLVLHAHTTGTGGPSVTWVYGKQNRYEEYWPAADHRGRIVNGQHKWDFPPGLRGRPYLAQGTALVHGKLTGAYVTYFDRRYSLSKPWTAPGNACSRTDALSMGGPPVPTPHWSAFIDATLACGAARVTGHVWIGGAQVMKITGKPVTVKLSPGYSKAVGEKYARARWILYVNPRTFLPVRVYGSTQTFGGPRRSHIFFAVTDMTWLPPTRANIAKTLVTIPSGFHRWRGNPGNQ
jgi:hypothetical protein